MKKLNTLLFLFITSIGLSQNSEWTYLFDGKSLDGWHQYNSDKMSDAWSIETVSYTHLTLPTIYSV